MSQVQPVFYRRPDVEKLTTLSRDSIYRLMREGKFPRPVRLGNRAVAWKVSDIEAWLESRAETVSQAGGV